MDRDGKVAPPQLDEAILRDLVDAAFDSLVITHAGRVVFANRSFVEMSGWSRDEVIGRSVLDFVAPESRGFVLEQLKSSTESRYEAKGTSRDGSPIDVEICARECVYQGQQARITAIRYINERKQAEAKLRRSEARLRQLIERMSDMIIVHRDGAIAFANPAALNYLGYERLDDIAGKPITHVIDPGDHSAALGCLMTATGPTSNAALATLRTRRKDRTTGVIEVATATVDDFDGRPAILVLGRDVAERKQMEARLVQADVLASMGTLAAGIAHEINNPLAYSTINLEVMARTMRALSDAVRDECGKGRAADLVQEVDKLLAVAREGADRVRHIVRDFKVFARGGTDERRPTQLIDVLESTLKVALNDIRHRARLEIDYGPTPLVDADEARLGQLFLNVLINAVQALDERKADQNEIRVVTRTAPDGAAVVEIADTGGGIAPELMGRVFEPFFSTKPIGVGTGLGLPICQSIVNSLNGTITLESTPGKGTVCRVTLPAIGDVGTTNERPDRTPERRPLRRCHLLIVDDEPAVLNSLANELGREHDVRRTSSAREAIALILSEPFDAVLCDVMMPGMNGIDVYETVRRARPGLERRLIFMTAGAFTASGQDFLRSVPNRTLEKPFTWDELYDALRDVASESADGAP